MIRRLTLLLAGLLAFTGIGFAEDALLMSEKQVRDKHRGESITNPFVLPGTDKSLLVGKLGSGRSRTYGFSKDDKAIVIVETWNKRIEPREKVLSDCRSTKAWFWKVDDQWLPVGTLPPDSKDRSPTEHQNGKGNDNLNIPDAFATSKKEGNILIVSDKSWGGDPGQINALMKELEALFAKYPAVFK